MGDEVQRSAGPPLSVQSAHPDKVHLRLPAAHLRAELDLCSSESRRLRVKDSVIKRLRASYAPKVVMDSLVEVPLFKVRKEIKQSNRKNQMVFFAFSSSCEGN